MAGYEIGSLVWKITGDTSGIDKSLSETTAKAKSSGITISESFRRIEQSAKLFGSQITELKDKNTVLRGKMEELIAKGVEPTNKGFAKLKSQYDENKKKLSELGSETSNSINVFARFSGAAGILAAVKGIYELGKAALTATGRMEQNEVAFTTMLGSADKANALLKDMSKFAMSTPFELPQVVDASKKLLAFGISSEQVIPVMRSLGDLAAGLGIDVGNLAVIYGKAAVSGRIMNDDLRQMAENGIPAIAELAKVLKVSESEVRNLAEKGKISFKDFQQSIINMTGEGSRFGGLMSNQAGTLIGQWSNFNDALGKTATVFGNMLMPAAKNTLGVMNGLLGIATGLLERYSAWSEAQEHHASLLELNNAKLNNYSEKLTAIIRYEKEKGAQALLYSKYLNGEVTLSDRMIKKLQDVLKLNRTIGDIAGAEKIKEIEISKKAAAATEEQKKAALKFADERKKTIEDYNKFVNTALGFETANLDAELAERTAAVNKYFKNKEDKIVAIATLEAIYADKREQLEWDAVKKQVDAVNTYVSAGIGAFNTLASAFDAYIQARLQADIDALDAQMEAELEAAGVSEETTVEQAQREYDAAVQTGDALAIEEKRRALVKAQIEEKYQKKKADLEYQAALRAWQFQMATAAAQIPLATMNAIASGFQAPPWMLPWFPIAMGAVAATATTMQLAAVAESKPQPPKFAAGGIIPGSAQGTNIIAGENNRTEVVMNPDQMANTLMAIGNGRGGGGVTLAQMPPVSEAAFYKMIFDASQNGDLYIAQRAVTNK